MNDSTRDGKVTFWLRRAGELGVPEAQHYLGMSALNSPVSSIRDSAVYWIRKATLQKDPESENDMGGFYKGRDNCAKK